MNQKRLFFAYKVMAPWPDSLPHGRIIQNEQRHLTTVFLGNCDSKVLMDSIKNIPIPPQSPGLAGLFDACLFLPKKNPHVAAWHINWINNPNEFITYQKDLTNWLSSIGYPSLNPGKEWLPHVTIARQPFNEISWKNAFTPLPMTIGNLCLYESLGNLQYQPIWEYPIIPAFKEIDHTADLAFEIYGTTFDQLHLNAETALGFIFPELMQFRTPVPSLNSIDEIVMHLNELICQVDINIGCPIKAVSFHGKLKEISSSILCWEMIIDV